LQVGTLASNILKAKASLTHIAAAAVRCNDQIFLDPFKSDPGQRWQAAKAQDLLEALVWSWESQNHGNIKTLSQYVAKVLSDNSNLVASFDCGNKAEHNTCTDYVSPKCVSNYL
jgi:hypothetical protein